MYLWSKNLLGDENVEVISFSGYLLKTFRPTILHKLNVFGRELKK